MAITADYAESVHHESIVIDATCPLLREVEYADWWIEGGATAAAPTVGGSEPAGDTFRAIAHWHRIVEQDSRFRLVRSAKDVRGAKESGQFGIILHFQGTEPIENDLNLVGAYKQLGVGIIQLAYNVKNRVGDGCEERTDCGLSNFGMDLIARFNESRVIVDCSHTGYQSTLEAIEASSAPVVFSHANAKAVKPSDRTITDDQIRAVAKTGGLVGAVGFPAFVSDSTKPSLDNFIDHIDHFVNLVGIEHVGLGIDYFPGQAGVAELSTAEKAYQRAVESGRWKPRSYPPPPYHYPAGIETPRTLPNLTKRLLERGYDEEGVRKILGENWLRVYQDVWGE